MIIDVLPFILIVVGALVLGLIVGFAYAFHQCPKLTKDFIEAVLDGVEVTIPYKKHMEELEDESNN